MSHIKASIFITVCLCFSGGLYAEGGVVKAKAASTQQEEVTHWGTQEMRYRLASEHIERALKSSTTLVLDPDSLRERDVTVNQNSTMSVLGDTVSRMVVGGVLWVSELIHQKSQGRELHFGEAFRRAWEKTPDLVVMEFVAYEGEQAHRGMSVFKVGSSIEEQDGADDETLSMVPYVFKRHLGDGVLLPIIWETPNGERSEDRFHGLVYWPQIVQEKIPLPYELTY